MMRDGLRAVLEKARIEVIGEAGNGDEAIAEVARVRPDVLVIDIAMPGMNGIEATRRIMAEMPDTKVVGLSMNAERQYVIAMLDAGAVGYLLKNAASEELLVALEAIARGETYLSPAIAGSVVKHVRGESPAGTGPKRPLSAREREVVQLVAHGKSSKEIAAILHIAVPTVDTYRRQIMDKLNLRTIAELTKYAIREGLTSADR
jgi:DNA-binding NarL/FixJ family response regulator